MSRKTERKINYTINVKCQNKKKNNQVNSFNKIIFTRKRE